MTLKEARLHVKAWPERYRIIADYLRGDDTNTPLFIWKLEELKDYSDKWTIVHNSAPFGLGRNIDKFGAGEWLFFD